MVYCINVVYHIYPICKADILVYSNAHMLLKCKYSLLSYGWNS